MDALTMTNLFFQKNGVYFIFIEDWFYGRANQFYFFKKYLFFNVFNFKLNYTFLHRFIWSKILVKYSLFFNIYKKEFGVCFFDDASLKFYTFFLPFFGSLFNLKLFKQFLNFRFYIYFINNFINNKLIYFFIKFYLKNLEIFSFI